MHQHSKKLGIICAIIIIMALFLMPKSIQNNIPDLPIIKDFKMQNYHLGLDLKGGSHLDYKVDLSKAFRYNEDSNPDNDVVIPELVEGVRMTLEKRVNNLGVSEPNIYISKNADEYHVIVELAGIKDIEEAKAIVGKTIQLEFKELGDIEKMREESGTGVEIDPWIETGLDGSHFKRAQVVSNQIGEPVVTIEFDSEGAKMFGDITSRNVGKPVAIFVGGNLISSPTVQTEILSGLAEITGRFTLREAVTLKTDLNTGAIGAPVILSGQHQVEASLGEESLKRSINASAWGILFLILYMIYQYRLLGLIASGALMMYSIILLFILKTSGALGMPIVLTLAGVAGIILSIGMAVDANILIFERMKEEFEDGKNITSAIAIGFDRAWTSIRDSNISSLITCVILIWFGTSMIRGFAVNLSIGILVSMFTAITVTRSILYVILPKVGSKFRESFTKQNK